MRNLTNEESLDLFADLIDPAAEILQDAEIVELARRGKAPILMVKAAIKNHKDAVIQILAAVDGVPANEYKVNLLRLPIKLLELFNTPEVQELFTLQGQQTAPASSGSATENTEGAES